MHLVLRADVTGNLSMRHPSSFLKVNKAVRDLALKYGVTIYEYANVGNHLHILIKIGHRRLWARFIRELTGRIAQQVQGLRGRAKGKRFWLYKPYTRVIQGWGRAYKAAKEYVVFNQWEAEGNISRKDFRSLRELRETWAAHYV
ncbi:MAG: transposase [Bdellovibrionales bacterium]|nr:transposase [Bdellovibrionales bacterium]